MYRDTRMSSSFRFTALRTVVIRSSDLSSSLFQEQPETPGVVEEMLTSSDVKNFMEKFSSTATSLQRVSVV